jgi:hypothetical protein
MTRARKKNEKGFALLLAVIVSSVMLSIGVSILKISVNQVNLSTTARESEMSFQAAHAGIECLTYWRHEKADEFIDAARVGSNPSITCFGNTPLGVERQTFVLGGNSYLHSYEHTFQWGTPTRCTALVTYVINASLGTQDAVVDMTFHEGVGSNGMKTCVAGNICTVIVSDGFNRACADVDASIFSIQREITVEF